jgi:type IV pilus assembly protein PilW
MTMNPNRSQLGVSLVEVMVAMAIGLGLLTVLATVFASSSRSQKEVTLTAQQVENGRYALELLTDDLRHAGFYGTYFNLTTAAALTDPCSVDPAIIRTGLRLPVQGYDSSAASPVTCLDDGNHVDGTDVVVVRRASTNVVTAATAAANANVVYIQGTASPNNTNNPIVALGSGTFNLNIRNGTGANVTAPIRKFETHIYFVAPCSVPTGAGGVCTATDDGGTPIPTLKRLELTTDAGGNTAFVTVPLVEGIDNLQLEYGVDTDNDGGPNGALSGDPGTPAAWQNAMVARVYVLARNTQPSPGYIDNKTYNMGATSVAAPGDNFRRHLYTGAIRLKNVSERRDTP